MENEQPKRTEIGSLGEFGLIKVLTAPFKTANESTLKAVGDDAAVIDCGNGNCKVITTDMLVEGIHFDMMYVPLKHLGYKSVVVNLSDIYAMNATPKQITVSMAISNRFSVEALEEIYEGIRHACSVYGVDLVGGDTTSSLKGLVISITAIGEAKTEDIIYRDGAKKGDLICVSGDLGAAYLGLQLMEREKRLFLEHPETQPDLENQAYLVGRQLKPEARKDIIEELKQAGVRPTAMIDVSDGLSSDMLHICTQSNVGCEIEEDAVPIMNDAFKKAVDFHLDPITCALNGGEDYELLFTVNREDKAKIDQMNDVSIIGVITDAAEGYKLKTKQGNLHELKAQGWDALLKVERMKREN
jgi:thiamine-monophosphate kinase